MKETTPNRPVHVVEFDRLNKEELKRLLKWCDTCCFNLYSTQIGDHGYRFLFKSQQDAQLFVMNTKLLFDPEDPWLEQDI